VVDELAGDLPGDAAVADDDRGAQHGDGHAVAAQQVLDLAARAQVRGQVLVLAADFFIMQ
jgi:hypothetical protein